MVTQINPVPSPAPATPPARTGGLKVAGAIGAAIAAILGGVYANEGGYVNNPNDPGGPTRFGVTQAVARAAGYRGDMRYFPKHCSGPVTVCADDIYLNRYIVAPGFLPIVEADPAVGGELVDSAVNFGPTRPSCWLQQTLNEFHASPVLKVDCKVGPRTVARYRQVQRNMGKVTACVRTLDGLDSKQRAEYDRLIRVNPKLRTFHKGWIAHRIGNIDRKTCGQGID